MRAFLPIRVVPLFGGLCIVSLCGCERVSISYHDHQPAHRHVWVKSYCSDCAHDCLLCSGCHRYRHQTVAVRVEPAHQHHWALKYCKRCRSRCRHCDGCADVLHVGARLRVAPAVHTHRWSLAWCDSCQRKCRRCAGCAKVRHVAVSKGKGKAPIKKRTRKSRKGA